MVGLALVGRAPALASTPLAPQASNVYEVTSADTADTITAVINGTQLSASGAYDGIHFKTANTYTLTESLDPRRDFSVETDAAVTFSGYGFSLAKTDDIVTLSFKGTAPLTLEGATHGIDTSAAEGTVTVEVASDAALNITGTRRYGMTTTGTISVAGTLDITNCNTEGTEGGLGMDGGTLSITNGGHVSCSGNGATGSGDFYTTGSVTVEKSGSTLDVGKTTQTDGTMTLAGGATLKISDGAVVTVTQDSGSATKSRAIDLGPTYSPGSTFSTVTVERSGKLIATVTTSDSTTSAIRGGELDVSGGGIVEASATNGIALDGVHLNAGGTSLVTAEGGVDDAKTTSSTTITGGSVLMRPAQSVVKGQMTSVTNGDKVDPTPVNNDRESLTRFDLSGFAGKQIAVAAGTSTYAYQVGSDHDGTAYVWAPAVRVRFYDSQADCSATTAGTGTTGLLATDYTIRGNSVSLVNGIVPTAPTVEDETFIGWVDKETGKIVDPSATSLSKDVDLYPAYVPVSDADVPIDVYVDDGTGSTTVNFINGPHYSSVGEQPMYETTVDLSAVQTTANSFGNSVSRLKGSLTITMTGSAGLAPAEGTTYSSDISTYFAGGTALSLFDLVAAPTYDASTNTTTFQLKVKDDYSADSYKGTGNDLASLIQGQGGFLGVSKRGDFDSATTSSLATEGYARMKVALSGTLTIWKADTAEGTTFQMTGVQDTDHAHGHEADPTLGKYGTADPSTTVSATLLYRKPVALDTSQAALLDMTVTGSGFAGKTFGFSIEPVGSAPAPTSSTGSATFSAAGTQTVSFGSITFDKAGTYQYTVQETTPSGDGWTCDTSAKTVTVTVTEDSTGKLSATVSQAATISNAYVEPPDVAIVYSATAGGTVTPASESVAPVTGVAKGATATANPGYHFVNWTDASGNVVSEAATFVPAKVSDAYVAAAYTANFAGNAYTVAFDANGGTGSMQGQAMTYGTPAALSANAYSRDGYAFAGWNTKADGSGTAYVDAATVSNLATEAGTTVTLYAQWRAAQVQARTFVIDGVEVTATLTDSSESIDNLVVAKRVSASDAVTGALGGRTLQGDWDVYFTDGRTSGFGTLELTFPATGERVQVLEVHSGKLTEGDVQEVSGGTVTASVTTLSEFAVVSAPAEVATSTTTTSTPATGDGSGTALPALLLAAAGAALAALGDRGKRRTGSRG